MGFTLRIAVSGAILTWLAFRLDWAHVADAFRGLRWGYWFAAVLLYLACQFLCCIRWQWLSRPLGFSDSLGRLTGIYFVGMFFNLFLPTSVGGDAVKALYLARGSGRKLAAVASVLLDRASGLMALLVVACIAAACSPIEIPANLKWAVWGLAACTFLGMCALPWIGNLAGLLPEHSTLGQLGRSIADSIALYRSRPGILASTTGLSLAVQALNALLVWLLGLALHLDVPAVYYGVAAPMVTLVTLIPISLNGMGLREGGMALFLAPAGASAADAVTLAFLWFCVQTATSLAGAGVYLAGRLGTAEEQPGERSALDHRSRQGRAGERRAAA